MRRAVLFLLLALVAYAPFLAYPSWRGTEALRVQVAQEMVETGDFVVPRLWGEPIFTKPPLYYWTLATSFRLFGVGMASARLPSVLAFALLAWLACRMLTKWYDERTGLLGLPEGVLIAHGTGIVERDLPVLKRATGPVAVASAPRGYLKFAWPTTPVRALRRLGIPVGLATDGAASNNSLDVWEAMALTALVQKSTEGDPRWLTSRQALHHATLQSARAVGLGEAVGSLAPGRRADIVLVDLTGPHTQPVHDLAATLVHSARSADVTTTIVDGRVLMRDRELRTVDVAATVREMTGRLAALTDRSHGGRIQDYDKAPE